MSASVDQSREHPNRRIQANALIEQFTLIYGFGKWTKNRLSSNIVRQLASGRFADYTSKWLVLSCL